MSLVNTLFTHTVNKNDTVYGIISGAGQKQQVPSNSGSPAGHEMDHKRKPAAVLQQTKRSILNNNGKLFSRNNSVSRTCLPSEI